MSDAHKEILCRLDEMDVLIKSLSNEIAAVQATADKIFANLTKVVGIDVKHGSPPVSPPNP